MKTYSCPNKDNSKVCLLSLYPLVREMDGKHFYGVLQNEEKIWLVMDKLSFRVIDTLKDDCGDIYDKSDVGDCENGSDVNMPNKRPEEGFVYVTDTSCDYMKHTEQHLSLDTIRDKILSIVEAYELESDSDKENNNISSEFNITDGREDIKAELYRYENYVMRHFKSRYFDKVVELTDRRSEWKYLKVNDIKVDYEMCPISPVLMFSGEEIAVRTKSPVSDSFLGISYDKLKNDSWNPVGLLDEIMLKYGRKTVRYDGVRVLDDMFEIEDMLRKSANDSIKEILKSCSFTKDA